MRCSAPTMSVSTTPIIAAASTHRAQTNSTSQATRRRPRGSTTCSRSSAMVKQNPTSATGSDSGWQLARRLLILRTQCVEESEQFDQFGYAAADSGLHEDELQVRVDNDILSAKAA